MLWTQVMKEWSMEEARPQSPGIQGGSRAFSLVSCWIQVAADWRSVELRGKSQGEYNLSTVLHTDSR